MEIQRCYFCGCFFFKVQLINSYYYKRIDIQNLTSHSRLFLQRFLFNNFIEPGRNQERPAFTASLTSSITLQPNEVLKFDKVWLNIGNVYDPSTGVFTVPRNGLYFVSSTVMASRGLHLHCHLWKNNQSDVGMFGTDYSTGTLNTVMALKKGDRIYAKHDHNKDGEQLYGNHWSMFSAYLISE